MCAVAAKRQCLCLFDKRYSRCLYTAGTVCVSCWRVAVRYREGVMNTFMYMCCASLYGVCCVHIYVIHTYVRTMMYFVKRLCRYCCSLISDLFCFSHNTGTTHWTDPRVLTKRDSIEKTPLPNGTFLRDFMGFKMLILPFAHISWLNNHWKSLKMYMNIRYI